MRKKQSKAKAYLKAKKLLIGDFLDFSLQDLKNESLGIAKYDSIILENVPPSLGLPFWEDLIHVSRIALKDKCKAYVVLPRKGLLLPYEILRENEEFTIYTIAK